MKPRRQTSAKPLLFLPLVLVYGGLAALPIAIVVQMSLEGGVASFSKLASSGLFWRTIENTLVISAQATVVAVLLGYLLAALLWRTSGMTRLVVMGFILLPFWTAALIKNFAWALLLQDNGPINGTLIWLGLVDQPVPLLHNRFAVIVGMVHYLLPYAVFPIYSAMLAIDGRLERAARSLGASGTAAFLLIILPLTRPGLYAATLLVFIISAGFYITPVVLGGPADLMVANLVEFYAHEVLDFNTAAALSVLVFAGASVLIAIYQLLPKEGQHGST